MNNNLDYTPPEIPEPTPEQEDTRTALITRAQALVAQATAITISTTAQMEDASTFLTDVAAARKAIETRRQEWVKPLNDSVREINARFKHMLDPLDQAVSIVKDKMLAYQREAQRQAQEEQERLQCEADAARTKLLEAMPEGQVLPGPWEVPTVIPIAPRKTRVDQGTVYTVQEWTYEVVNESEVPKEYWMLDRVKLARVVRAGIRNILGIRVFQRESIAVRTIHSTGGA